MLIKNPQSQGQKPPETVSEQALQNALEDAPVADCIHCLGRCKHLPSAARSTALYRLSLESDTRLQQVLLNHLIPDLSADELEPLLSLLASEKANLRNQVIDALAQIPDGETADALQGAIEDRLQADDPDVRILTLNLIAALERPALLPAVAKVIRTDPDINVCMTALDALMVLGTDADWPLAQVLGERFPDDPFVRFGVDRAGQTLLGDG